jgi:hypothetical protein
LKIDDGELQILRKAMEKVLEWSLKTLARLTRDSSTLLMWLKSCHADHPSPQPFRLPQEPTTVKRYVNHWTHFIFYVIRTSLLDQVTREREYGIQFTEYQLGIIKRLLEILNEYNQSKNQMDKFDYMDSDIDDDDEEDDEDFYRYDPEEDDIEYENENLESDVTDHDDGSASISVDVNAEHQSLLLTQMAEKLMQLSITFITEDFPSGDNIHSPLVHFADVMGISNRTGQFNEPYTYTSHVAGLMWMCRLLIMEYALLSREYITLGWQSHNAYENKGRRLRGMHEEHLIQGSFRPMNRLIRVLAFGKETVKAVSRPCYIVWDPDDLGLKIKGVHLRLDTFKKFVHDGIQLTETILREQLFFGTDLPTIDLKAITDEFGKADSGYSFLKESTNKLPKGQEFMLNLMKSVDSSKHLIDAQGRWDHIKVAEYLKTKKNFLRKLMKGRWLFKG